LGDDKLTPPGPTLLRSWLHSKGPGTLEGKRVVLHQFVVQVYEPPVRAVSSADAAGIAGLALAHGFAAITSEKTVMVRIEGTVDGQQFTAVKWGGFRAGVSQNNINSVIRQTLDAAVASITETLAAKKEPATDE
jgi:hypothetical protein